MSTDEELEPLEDKVCRELNRTREKRLKRKDLPEELMEFTLVTEFTDKQWTTMCLAMVHKHKSMSSDRIMELKE